MKHTTKLSDIATVRTGFTFRSRLAEQVSGNAYVLQIKDLRAYHEQTGSDLLHRACLPQIQWEGKDNAFVAPGTILLPSKGGYFRAACLSAENNELPLVASSQFLLVSPVSKNLIPEFLCWALNRPQMQHYLEEIASQGTSVPMLSRAAAEELELDIPDLATQQKILRLNQLWEKEQRLTRALLKNRETMLQGMFQHLLTENH